MHRLRSIAVWALQLLLAALFAIQGVMKLTGSGAWIARFKAWGYPDGFYLAVGCAELAGAAMLVFPRLASLGAALLMLVMTGAALTHAMHGERQLITTLVLIALLAIVFYLRRREPSRLTSQ